MGEEKKQPEEVKKAVEEPIPAAADEKKDEESKDPPPPQEVVLRVFMHCEGCARKVRRCLKGFEGVEDVVTNCKTHKVIVKGEKADPVKVLERVQKKSNRKVELLSPVPEPPAVEEEKKPEEEETAKPEEKKDEPPPVITVVLKIHMHCEACAQEIKKRILRMKGVESAIPDLKNSQVTVKGTFPASELLEHLHKKTGKTAVILNQDREPEEPKTGDGGDAAAGGGEKEEKNDGDGGEEKEEAEAEAAVEMRKNEYFYYYNNQPVNYQMYPPSYVAEQAYYPPPASQMFSDENPNACSVM